MFNITSEFSPQKEVFNVGDTIFFNSSFPKLMTNLVTNQIADYSNSVGIKGSFNSTLMDTALRRLRNGSENFEIFAIVGELNSNTSQSGSMIVTYRENSLNYESKIGIILKQRGLFYLSMSDLFSLSLVGQNCTNGGFNMAVTNTDKNIHLFEYALGYTPDAML